jgi:predicted permease
MGLRPVLGRLLGPNDDGPAAAGAAVLTHRYWTSALAADPGVVGKVLRLGSRSATVVGVLQPAVPYPTETELIANVVTSPHHLSAAMTTDRRHRMTELFGRLAPGADLEAARAELRAVSAALRAEHPEAYDPRSEFRVDAMGLRRQITANARSVLFVLLAAAGLIFLIACSNVANLLLARVTRRRPELSVRAALGASAGALRAVILAETLLLCAGGAAAGIAIAGPSVRLLARFASRFTVRAADVSIDATLLWTCAALSAVAAAAFAFLPGVPGPEPSRDAERSGAGARLKRGARRRQRVFAVAQIAACYVLLAGAGLLLRTLLALQATAPGFETESVLAVDVPVAAAGRSDDQIRGFYDEIRRRVSALPGVTGVALGSAVPWRDGEGLSSAAFAFTADGAAREDGGEDPRARFRSVSPGFFPTLGIPLSAGRDFHEDDRAASERVVIVSEAVARRLFAGRDAVGRTLRWTDERMRFIDVSTEPRRIVGVAPDIRDEAIGAEPPMTVYHPFSQEIGGGRLFVHAAGDAYALVPGITRIVRDLAADQPVERASTLEDIRADVLAPTRLNAVLLSGFALLALAIALVGVAGMLGFWVSGRTREFGIRMAVGSRPRDILTGVLREGAAVAIAGVGFGLAGSLLLRTLLGRFLPRVSPADPLLLALSAAVLALAAVAASAVPASRAARVDVVRALRAE